ncbi:hypothetical protein RHSIM_Rhsim07G0094300 [Rhododendron simsii]|uniref:Cytochrome P450 n=1 Tax=Rhododendron simsii TaxID=118357 RepID=A0A834GNV8_RHOSS|nr:hypothetical protein RHSIM_Rhsim07G0094300 [Rhododendron simsii]
MAETSIVFPILFLPLLLLLLLKYFKSTTSNSRPKTPPLPPGPTPWPVLGNIPHMGQKPHITLTEFAQFYGPLMSLKLGTQLLIVGSSPAAAAEILKTHDRVLSARHVPHALPVKTPELNPLSLAWAFECNDEWKHLRTVCRTELFSGKAVELQARLREEKAMEMVQFLRGMEGGVVKIKGVVFASVFNTLSNVLMSRDFMGLGEEESLGGGMEGLVRGIMEVASAPNLSDFYPVLGRLDLQGLRKRSEDLVARFFAMWETVIEERRRERAGSSASSHQDFLDSLLDDAFSNDQINQLFGPYSGSSQVEINSEKASFKSNTFKASVNILFADFIQRNERTAVERVKIPVLVDLEAAVESECLANDKTQTFGHLRILANGTILVESNIKIDEHIGRE